ncbi:hypothetical protein H4S02_004753 [Coemansia sp. RSA 2611]|nr:hypothetical protein LPJ70_001662 [Coemansia sp. RSA 2708]KAJ2364057.1 hypothetical protein H4S01_003978 [Coemansia sp. RSA 2610]KAJ2384566.1 hypothetical protein H4S02_004753 [Coemansia sp. RSA 2611]
MNIFMVASMAALAGQAAAHMALSDPCPIFSPHCTNEMTLPAGASYDYSITSPMPYDGDLSKGGASWSEPAATWTAGQDVTVKFFGTAYHSGGFAELALAYPGSDTFVVIFGDYGDFFVDPATKTGPVTSYTFRLPADVPSSDNVRLRWTWIQNVGNLELYLNLSTVKIVGSKSTSFTGPQQFIGNHKGYPSLPESMSRDEKLAYYKAMPNVTVTAGGAQPASGATYPTADAPASSAPASAPSPTGY